MTQHEYRPAIPGKNVTVSAATDTAPTHTQQSSQEWILELLLGPTRPTTHNHTDFTMDDLPIEDLHKQSTQIARNVPQACNNLHDEKDKAQYARRSRLSTTSFRHLHPDHRRCSTFDARRNLFYQKCHDEADHHSPKK